MEPFTPPLPEIPTEPLPPGVFRAAVVTVSDSCYAGTREDLSGPEAVGLLTGAGYRVTACTLLPDDRAMLSAELTRLCDGSLADLVITIGGTGFSPYSCTPEATLDVIERPAPGLPEAIRWFSFQHAPKIMFSRAVAGIRNSTLIVNLPGGPKAVSQCLGFLLPVLSHGLDGMKGSACNGSGTE